MSNPDVLETVTVPDFVGCLNCLWLPLVRASCQPSLSSILITSLTFTTL
jgi:hypothetical protein